MLFGAVSFGNGCADESRGGALEAPRVAVRRPADAGAADGAEMAPPVPSANRGDDPLHDAGTLRAALPEVVTPWCPSPWRGLDENTCWLLPEAAPSSLVIYLSGIVPPGPPGALQANMQQVVARAALRAGAAVLMPRGRAGLGPAATRSWWSWPTSKADVDRFAPAMVAGWFAARTRLEAALGAPFPHTYLAGSSSGAYFLTSLAVRGAIEVDGLAATAGGGAGTGALSAAPRMPPFYVGFGSGDPAASQLRGFGKALRGAGWPSLVREHPGGHGAREVYLDEAFAFWSSADARSEAR